jgi:mono/diheme cytochrome c family protein
MRASFVACILPMLALTVLVPQTVRAANDTPAGDAAAGGRIARERCTGCHTVDAVGPGTDVAPPFSRIAKERGQDRKWLRTWLGNAHPQMPDMNLSALEVENIIAYLDSLPGR